MTNTPKGNSKKSNNINKPTTKIFVTILVIAILVFIVKSTNNKKNVNLPVTQYKSFTNNIETSSNKNDIENIKQISSDARGQKNIPIAFSQLIPTPPVNDIKIDQYKRVWIATENGVYKLENDEITEFTIKNGKYPFPQASCIETDGKNLWIGSLFGICKYNDSGKFVDQTSKFSLPSNIVWDIKSDRNNLWISTQKGVVFYKSIDSDDESPDYSSNKDNRILIDNKTTNNGLRSSWCTKIARYLNFLAVIHDNGLSVLNIGFPVGSPNAWKNLAHTKLSISRPINDMAFDGKNIWIGTPTGLMMINTELKYFDSRFSTELISYSELHGLPSNNINSMIFHKNAIWLGTNNGLARIRNNNIQTISDISGKKPESIRKLAIQGEGDNITLLWIGTKSGVQFINTQMAD